MKSKALEEALKDASSEVVIKITDPNKEVYALVYEQPRRTLSAIPVEVARDRATTIANHVRYAFGCTHCEVVRNNGTTVLTADALHISWSEGFTPYRIVKSGYPSTVGLAGHDPQSN